MNAGEERDNDKLHHICQETEEALSKASDALSQLQNRRTRFEIKVWEREASFAQTELLDFIRSDRYAASPLTFANAMAGLPLIHWRQSMQRCLQFEYQADRQPKRGPTDSVLAGLTYSHFLIVEKVLKHPAANAEEAIERMKTRLMQANGQDVAVLNGLAANWYFLRRAIQTVFRASRTDPSEKLPHLIFAEYQNRHHGQESLDILLAPREVISTPVYLKERKRVTSIR